MKSGTRVSVTAEYPNGCRAGNIVFRSIEKLRDYVREFYGGDDIADKTDKVQSGL